MNEQHMPQRSEQEQQQHLAHLLGITGEELSQLHHGGLQEVTDSEQQIYKYFIHFTGDDNPVSILDKLDMDSHHTVYFSAEEWAAELQRSL
ncbi:hypothetical protein [Taibaiella koreensis]|uniref:hypothetical protein n=1 Tax=Taibaiella koreensis TaxID=1268548 RepID=UPI000E59D5F2|nr:hypothetical protein [Taibaiella koreensis]